MVIFCEASVSICVGLRRFPVALCVGPPRFLCRVPALSRSLRQDSLCRGPTLSVSGAGALCVGRRRSLRRARALPGALCVGARRSPQALSRCVRARHSLVLCVGPPALSRHGALCVGPALSASPSALGVRPRRFLCQAPALSPSLCRRSLCRGPAVLCRRSLRRAPLLSASALSRRFQCRARRFLCRGPALSVSLCGAAWRHSLCRARRSRVPPFIRSADPSSHPCHPFGPAGPQLGSACHPSGRAPTSHPRATHPARRAPFFQERTPKLTVWGNIYLLLYIYIYIYICIYIYVCINSYTYIIICISIYVFSLYIYIYICLYTFIYVYIYMYFYLFI